jgi:outer membrane lipopolysaccharide assembly protein LptE/RlpB
VLRIPLTLSLCFALCVSLSLGLTGCGFHLRGDFCIPPPLQILAISPDQPYDNFQRILRRILKDNQVQIIEYC